MKQLEERFPQERKGLGAGMGEYVLEGKLSPTFLMGYCGGTFDLAVSQVSFLYPMSYSFLRLRILEVGNFSY